MKTITIPTKFGYPKFDMYINGKKYTLTSGEEITVEDYVADVVENAIALAPKVKFQKSKLAQLAENTLEELTIEDLEGIYALSRCAFYSNLGLKRVTIPNSIREIGEDTFGWCVNLERVSLPEVPPTMSINAFKGVRTTCIFYCKTQASLDAYKAAANWSTLTNTYTFVVES